MSMPEVTEIQRWQLNPGDRLIVTTDRYLRDSDVAVVKARVRAALALPDDVPILVHGPDAEVKVISA